MGTGIYREILPPKIQHTGGAPVYGVLAGIWHRYIPVNPPPKIPHTVHAPVHSPVSLSQRLRPQLKNHTSSMPSPEPKAKCRHPRPSAEPKSHPAANAHREKSPKFHVLELPESKIPLTGTLRRRLDVPCSVQTSPTSAKVRLVLAPTPSRSTMSDSTCRAPQGWPAISKYKPLRCSHAATLS